LIDSLVAYKGKPARIIGQTTHKFDLEFADGSTRKVREKDFRYLHPDFSRVNDSCIEADVSILQEFQEDSLSLKEITEWLFNDYNPQNSWCTYQLVEDGLYFYWQKDKIFVRPTSQVESIQAKRDQEELEAKLLESCIENINNNTFTKEDVPHIKEIEKVALNQSKHSKVLSALKIENTPESAYKLLLKLKYLTPEFNPYPARFKISADEDMNIKTPDVDRVDLTNIASYAIDNEGSNDADDAISIDGDKVWIHIADVATVVNSGSELDEYALERASNLYLPDQILHMLPISVTNNCALGMSNTSSALSIGFIYDDGEINNIEIIKSKIKVSKLTYLEADGLISANNDLKKLNDIANNHLAYRDKNGAISLDLPNVSVRLIDNKVEIFQQSSSASRELVAELMVMAGRAAGKFAQDNDIVMPYAIQDEGEFTDEILERKKSLTLSESFKATKSFKRSAISTKPLLHYGLGLMGYIRITSPLRRYLDLLAHQQLTLFINSQPTLSKDRVKELIGINNAAQPSIGKTIRSSNDHYKCLYLQQNPDWTGTGTVVDVYKDKVLFMLPELGMMTQIKMKEIPELDSQIQLKVTSVDLVERLANFKIV